MTGAKILSEQNLPYTHIINEAQVSEKKALPKRSLIVLASAISSLLLMIFILAVSEMDYQGGGEEMNILWLIPPALILILFCSTFD